MQKYERVQKELKENGTSKMKCFGGSMMPLIKSGSLLTFEPRDEYEIGDIVFCRVGSNTYGAHKVLKKSQRGYLIGNNKGRENGWTKTIWGKAVHIEPPK
jgi:SOS-response transcriptional repressor LexA